MLDGEGVRPRPPALSNVIAGCSLALADPALAAFVDEALVNHVVRGTKSSYNTAARQYADFCSVRGLQAFPVEAITFCGWLITLASRVRVSSFPVYTSGVRYAQGLLGFPWLLRGNECVRRTIRWLKRRCPEPGKSQKVPVTIAVLRVIFLLLPGWPEMGDMSADDRVFAAASLMAVCGFLRGGEFLTSPRSDRPLLRFECVSISTVGSGEAVIVSVEQPKARFWLTDAKVPCFAACGDDDTFCPVRLWSDYVILSPVPLLPGRAAFLTSCGRPLSKAFMLKRTSALLAQSGIRFVDSLGRELAVRASSWRAGAVRSAIDAGVSEPVIKTFGRWDSSAWSSYLLESTLDLQGATVSMWASPRTRSLPHGLLGPQVGEFVSSSYVEDVDNREMRPIVGL